MLLMHRAGAVHATGITITTTTAVLAAGRT
jgi:hypothetical protein